MAKSANFYQKYTFFHLTRGSFGFYFWRMRRTQNLSFFILYFSPPSVLLFLFLFNYWFVCLFAINFVPRALFPFKRGKSGRGPLFRPISSLVFLCWSNSDSSVFVGRGFVLPWSEIRLTLL